MCFMTCKGFMIRDHFIIILGLLQNKMDGKRTFKEAKFTPKCFSEPMFAYAKSLGPEV